MANKDYVPYFNGADSVEVALYSHAHLAVAIGHEMGYRLTAHGSSWGRGPTELKFDRDDSEAARVRAAWAGYHYGVNGAWWATALPPGAPPGALSPQEAGKHRLKLFLVTRSSLRTARLRLAMAESLVLAVTVFFAFTAWPLALATGAFGVLLLVATPLTKARRDATAAGHRDVLARFEAQRVFWSYEGKGDGG
ncbi:hypothetical protein RM844_23005 [Streptomyces sp. DSM 44915]|uniref:Integral membrane protein n=1 Tax=Streptomyces chisholmiae TaxID=3075540 RepID=A0ABU2JVX9_9ACTN|nr:hypothetical protein [Streptomyces sp. DSM 44915]MDT0269160.1 hypothetical protein [Streptomyces sp. DSM 44915]